MKPSRAEPGQRRGIGGSGGAQVSREFVRLALAEAHPAFQMAAQRGVEGFEEFAARRPHPAASRSCGRSLRPLRAWPRGCPAAARLPAPAIRVRRKRSVPPRRSGNRGCDQARATSLFAALRRAPPPPRCPLPDRLRARHPCW